MFYTEFEIGLILWLFITISMIVTILIIFFNGMKWDWAEIKKLRADKEALTEILLAFLNKNQEVKNEELTEKAGGLPG